MNNNTAVSIWKLTEDEASSGANAPIRPALQKNLRADAAVIGGGMAGVLTAYFLQEKGLHTVLLEAGETGGGQTGNTTAKITSQHGLIYHRLKEQLGEAPARQYAGANQRAIEEYRRIISENAVDCDFTPCSAFLYTASLENQDAFERECRAAESLGLPAALTKETELPFPVAAALRFEGQARFHPLKFLRALTEPLELYEHTAVQSVEGKRIVTPGGEVAADHIIFACHYPFLNTPGYYFMRMHQERSYVLALENAEQMENMYLGTDPGGLSFRPCGQRLLLGGGNHRTGENQAGGQYRKLREEARRYWPNHREAAHWSAQDCMTLDGVPYIGPFSAAAPNWYVATGFQKWGMTSSMVSAMLLSDLVTKGESPWQEVFSPQRFRPSSSAQQLMKETAHAAKGLTRRFFTPPSADIAALPPGHGGVVECGGEKIGVYKDESGETYLVSVRCPHLGCQLEWNPDEKSWDCPCHGSRFDYRGNRIDNPAQENLKRPEGS